jgi:hypothetical protein
LAVRLLCELGLLAALALWGVHAGSGLPAELILGVGAPLLAVVVWGLFVAPASRRRLADPMRLVVEVVLFTAGAVALGAAGWLQAAVIFAVVVAGNIILDRALSQRAPA